MADGSPADQVGLSDAGVRPLRTASGSPRRLPDDSEIEIRDASANVSCRSSSRTTSSMAIAEFEPALKRPTWTAVLHEWVVSVDHKRIGIMYFLMAVAFLVIGGAEAMVMRWQLLWP